MSKIKRDDLIVVIVDKNKDKQRKIISVGAKKNKVLIQNCNMIAKHTKQAPGNLQDGIINREIPIDISNIMLVADGRTTKVGFEGKDGKEVRVAETTGEAVD